MAQVKLLKIDTDGVPVEFNSASDEITLASFSVQGGGPVLSSTGLDMNNQDVSDVNDLVFNDPSTGTVNQTAGALIIDNLMAKERSNVMTTAADILFPTITDSSGQVDAFRLPQLAGSPTQTPTASGEGFVVWDSSNDKLFIWNGTSWDDQSTVSAANAIDDSYTAAVNIAAVDAVYISAANTVDLAQALSGAPSRLLGFATASALAAASVNIRKYGKLSGFTGLTAGSRYYVDPTTPGAITATVPAGAGNTIVQAGYAFATTGLDIQIQQLGRRA